ncbi:MAG: type II secretion system protein [Rhodocyclaceae bacterium]|nr:MAG: type II secretion system protein [Rhodocyclaceae bacterium]
MKRQGKLQAGFTYLALLFAVALSGVALAAVGSLWSVERQREKEDELLTIGDQFRAAIASYYERSPGLVKRYPATLDDLAKDNRFLKTQRHLRQVYRDPLTGQNVWGLVSAPEGGIMGVYSLSKAAPMKRSGFALADAEFKGKEKVEDWRFVYRPAKDSMPAAATPSNNLFKKTPNG